jgi:hypothetical protein
MAKAEPEDIEEARALLREMVWQLFFSDGEAVPLTEQWRRLVTIWYNRLGPELEHPNDDEVKAMARKFLADIVQNDPNNTSGKTRDDLLYECHQTGCDISDRRFRHVWDDVATPAYKRPGPHRKRRK